MAGPGVTVEEASKHLDVAKDSAHRWIDLASRRTGHRWKCRGSHSYEWKPADRAGATTSNEARTRSVGGGR